MSIDINYLAAGDQDQLTPFVMDGTCEGTRKLMQKCMMLVLGDKSSVFRPEAIGLYQNLKSATIQDYTLEVIRNKLTTGANTVQLNIRKEQSSDSSLPDTEKLYTFNLVSVQADDQASLTVIFKAVSVSGASVTVSTTI